MKLNETVLLRFNFIESVLESVYRKNNYKHLPFELSHRCSVIDTCSKDIYYFFRHILQDHNEAHRALHLLKQCGGNLYLFYLQLDESIQAKLLSFDMQEYDKSGPKLLD